MIMFQPSQFCLGWLEKLAWFPTTSPGEEAVEGWGWGALEGQPHLPTTFVLSVTCHKAQRRKLYLSVTWKSWIPRVKANCGMLSRNVAANWSPLCFLDCNSVCVHFEQDFFLKKHTLGKYHNHNPLHQHHHHHHHHQHNPHRHHHHIIIITTTIIIIIITIITIIIIFSTIITINSII